MIDPKELRIGNKILRMGNVVTVSTIDDCREEHYSSFLIGNYEDLASYTPKEYEPIPLTPEILERCGFGIKEPSITFAWKFAKSGEVAHVKCKYLHQLQNLYQSLTGEELEIKELQNND